MIVAFGAFDTSSSGLVMIVVGGLVPKICDDGIVVIAIGVIWWSPLGEMSRNEATGLCRCP